PLRTHRPYREAWPQSKTLSYIEDRAGTEFDPELAGAFVRMMRQWEPQVAVMTDERNPVPATGEAGAGPAATCSIPRRGGYLCTPPLARSLVTVRYSSLLVLLLGIAPGLSAQSAHSGAGPRARLEGKWQAKTDEEIRNIMVRSDSSAQFGDQVARWRVVGDS